MHKITEHIGKTADKIMGPCVRSIKIPDQNNLYLTFDDGPVSKNTEAILKLLEINNAPATFFVVGATAEKNPAIIKEMLHLGHSVGDHSSDHNWINYFCSFAETETWIKNSFTALTELCGERPIGFRAPYGIRTPKIHAAIKKLQIPLIHWNTRFYDTIKPWTIMGAKSSLEQATNGDIILLHDRGKSELDKFLKTLECYIFAAKERGFTFSKIPAFLSPNSG